MPSEPWNDITTLEGGYPTYNATATETWGEYVQRNLDRLYMPPGVRCGKTQNQNLTSGVGSIYLTWDVEDWDTDGFHSTSANTEKITIPAGLDGIYRLDASALFGSMVAIDNGGGQSHFFVEFLWDDGTQTGIRQTGLFSDSGNLRSIPSSVLHAGGELAMSAGDAVKVRVYHNGSDELSPVVQGNEWTWVTARWVAPLP